jgi:hypothetical protein
MIDYPSPERLIALPGIHGCVMCNAAGEVVGSAGDDQALPPSGALALTRLAMLCGESLHLGRLRELEFQSDGVAVCCAAREDDVFVVAGASRSSVAAACMRLDAGPA